MQYVAEHFDEDEQAILRPYFTNLDGPRKGVASLYASQIVPILSLPTALRGRLRQVHQRFQAIITIQQVEGSAVPWVAA